MRMAKQAKDTQRLDVKLARDGALWAVLAVIPGQPDMHLAGLLTEENRALYLSWHPEWTIIEGGKA
jgi:hypothetical protein